MKGRPIISFYDQALKLLSNRPHAEKELRQKLSVLSKKRYCRRVYRNNLNEKKNGALKFSSSLEVFENEATPEDEVPEIDETISRLKTEGLIDDKSFASWYCLQRQDFNQRSERVLYMELLMKGISPSIIKETIKDYHSEDECCRLIMMRKVGTMDREKMISYLLGKVVIIGIVFIIRDLGWTQ